MIRRPPRSTPLYSSAASDVYKRQAFHGCKTKCLTSLKHYFGQLLMTTSVQRGCWSIFEDTTRTFNSMRFKPSTKSILGLIGFILLGTAIWRFQELVGFLLVSVALSFVGRPLVLFSQRIKFRGAALPSSIGAVVALATMVGLTIGLTQLFAPLFAEQARAVQSIDQAGVERLAGETLTWVDSNFNWLNLSGDDQSNTDFLLSLIHISEPTRPY